MFSPDSSGFVLLSHRCRGSRPRTLLDIVCGFLLFTPRLNSPSMTPHHIILNHITHTHGHSYRTVRRPAHRVRAFFTSRLRPVTSILVFDLVCVHHSSHFSGYGHLLLVIASHSFFPRVCERSIRRIRFGSLDGCRPSTINRCFSDILSSSDESLLKTLYCRVFTSRSA